MGHQQNQTQTTSLDSTSPISPSTKARVVITGVGLTSPIGNDLKTFRQNLLEGKSNVQRMPIRVMGSVLAGICDYDAERYQSKKEIRTGTRAGSIGIFCAHEAILSSRIDWEKCDKSRVGIYIGITEHGNVETENEVTHLYERKGDVSCWTHHHNPRTVANNPAGEISVNLKIEGPHYTLGGACAAGNLGLIQGVQMLQLGEVDFALVGGVSESIHTFGIFASFKNQGALAEHFDPSKASRPFDLARNGIVVSEGGCIFTLERLEDALQRGASILGEVGGYAINSDATSTVLPNPERQAKCVELALKRAYLSPKEIDIVSTHATSTGMGDEQECQALRSVFGDCSNTYFNNTKSFIGHAMGAAGALELAGNLPSFNDDSIHPTINIEQLDPKCELKTIVINQAIRQHPVNTILNNSFGMLGINSVVIVKKWA